MLSRIVVDFTCTKKLDYQSRFFFVFFLNALSKIDEFDYLSPSGHIKSIAASVTTKSSNKLTVYTIFLFIYS